MSILFAGPSALDALRQTRCDNSYHQLCPVSAKGQRKAPELWEIDHAQRFLSNRIVDLVVEVSADRYRLPRKQVQYIVDSAPKPRNAVLSLDRHSSLPSPELLFLQMHRFLSDTECIALGMELCGTYARQGSDAIAYHLPPCTSKTKIQKFLNRLTPRYCLARAKRNIALVHDNSCSLRESQLALILSLPPRLGGYGFEDPILNRPFDVSSAVEQRHGNDTRWVDISWPAAKLAVEYDSNEFHSGAEKIKHDASRRTLLQAIGVEVIVVTNSQLKSIHELDLIAKAIARALGKRQRCSIKDYEKRKRELHRTVLSLDF